MPNAEIHFVTKKQFEGILKENPYLSKIHVLENGLMPLLKSLQKEHFDLIIDLHHNLRSLILRLFLGKKAFAFQKLNFEKWLLVQFKINKMPKSHIVDRYLETTKSLGVQNDGKGLDFFYCPCDAIEPEYLPETHRDKFVSFAIGGQHQTKKLPLEKMKEVCQTIAFPIILLGGKEDKAMGEKLAESFGTKIFNACGMFNLGGSADLTKKALFVVTHDTGMMHIAAALKKKTYAIWGNTVPEFGMYPYQTAHFNIQNENLSCRPCSKIGFEACPKGHFNCMNALSFEALAQENSENH